MRYLKVLLCFSLIAVLSNAYGEAPLQATIEACADKGDGDACDFMNKSGEDIDGFCRTTNIDGEGKLICIASQ